MCIRDRFWDNNNFLNKVYTTICRQRFKAVSYTHLDVYKRQTIACLQPKADLLEVVGVVFVVFLYVLI